MERAEARPPTTLIVEFIDQHKNEFDIEPIRRLHRENFAVYGARRVHAQLRREGIEVARCTVERLMWRQGLRGISRAKGPRTTVPGRVPDTRSGLVERGFRAAAPNQLWVADMTYFRTFASWAYAAFVIDVFSRRVVGWQLSNSLRGDLALDALGKWASGPGGTRSRTWPG